MSRTPGPRGGHGMQAEKAKVEKPGVTLKRLWSYLKVHKIGLIIGLTTVVIGSLASVASNAFLKPIINSLVDGTGFAVFMRYLLMLAAVMLLSALMNFIGMRLMGRIAQKTSKNIRAALFSHMQMLPIKFFDTHKLGDLMSSYTNDVDNINQALEQTLPNILTSILTLVGTFIMMLTLSPLLTVMVVLMMLLMLFIIMQVGKRSAANFRRQQASLGDMNAYVEETMNGQKVVKVFNREQAAELDFSEKNESLRQSATKAQTFAVIMMPIMGNLSYISYALTASLGAVLVINGNLDIGSIGAFLQYSRSFSMPLTQLSNQMNLLIAAVAGAERVFKLMDEPIEEDPGDVCIDDLSVGRDQLCWRVPLEDGSFEFVPVRGDIRFNQVDFSYVPGKKVLKNISLYAKPGQKIALVGSTGAGKTTITNLLNRFYEIDSGSITYDGIDIRRICKEALRRTLGMVLQDVHLFEGSIADNIRYGKLDATDEEIIRAAKVANAHTFIKHLPDGYDTILSREGMNLSQGQRQLLSIARAAVADPVILILDEATSSIDTRTERLIELGMDALMKDRTTFSIAHRLSTVRHSNAIMVLEQGEIIERGDHDDLMANKGRYYALNMGTVELD